MMSTSERNEFPGSSSAKCSCLVNLMLTDLMLKPEMWGARR
jgi:hypothetical protein